jgi:hypothetical protein
MASRMTSRKKPGVAFWATVALAIVLAYPLSFGPACWIGSRIDVTDTGRPILMYVYYPLLIAAADAPEWVRVPLVWWKDVGKRPTEIMIMPGTADPDDE